MDNQTFHPPTPSLPLKRDLKPASVSTIILAFLMTAASLGGLLFPSGIYPTDELRQAFLTNDVVNLLIGLPILLGAMWLTQHSKLIGLLCWPGAALYVFYNYLIYLLGVPISWVTPVFGILVLMSAYLIFDLMRNIDKDTLQAQLTGAVPEKLSGGVLSLFGLAFFFLAVNVITEANINQTGLPMSEVGLAISDMLLSVLLFISGISLFLRKSLGYASGLGLLFAASVLFIGLVLVLILQPIMTDAPFVLTDVLVVLVMGLICFLPTGLFMRGVASKR